MNIELLKLLIQSACVNGQITAERRQYLQGKASEMNISTTDLDFLIANELALQNKTTISDALAASVLETIEPEKTQPQIHINKTELNFGKVQPNQRCGDVIEIRNLGSVDNLNWYFSKKPSWVTTHIENNNLHIDLNTSQEAILDDKILIESNGGNVEIRIRIEIVDEQRKMITYAIVGLVLVILVIVALVFIPKLFKKEDHTIEALPLDSIQKEIRDTQKFESIDEKLAKKKLRDQMNKRVKTDTVKEEILEQ